MYIKKYKAIIKVRVEYLDDEKMDNFLQMRIVDCWKLELCNIFFNRIKE